MAVKGINIRVPGGKGIFEGRYMAISSYAQVE